MAAPAVVGTVAELWRYPVKSLGGERVDELACDMRGAEGDRLWAVRGADGKIGSGKTTRRFRRMPGLLSMTARTDEEGEVWVGLPGGAETAVSDPRASGRVGAVVGERVWLAREGATSHFDDAPLHLVTTGSLSWLAARRPGDQVERRRFRPNVVIETAGSGRPEDDWVGRPLRLGEVQVEVRKATERCVMTTMPQPRLHRAAGLLKALESSSDGLFGVYARVLLAGRIRVGDEVALADALGAPVPDSMEGA